MTAGADDIRDGRLRDRWRLLRFLTMSGSPTYRGLSPTEIANAIRRRWHTPENVKHTLYLIQHADPPLEGRDRSDQLAKAALQRRLPDAMADVKRRFKQLTTFLREFRDSGSPGQYEAAERAVAELRSLAGVHSLIEDEERTGTETGDGIRPEPESETSSALREARRVAELLQRRLSDDWIRRNKREQREAERRAERERRHDRRAKERRGYEERKEDYKRQLKLFKPLEDVYPELRPTHPGLGRELGLKHAEGIGVALLAYINSLSEEDRQKFLATPNVVGFTDEAVRLYEQMRRDQERESQESLAALRSKSREVASYGSDDWLARAPGTCFSAPRAMVLRWTQAGGVQTRVSRNTPVWIPFTREEILDAVRAALSARVQERGCAQGVTAEQVFVASKLAELARSTPGSGGWVQLQGTMFFLPSRVRALYGDLRPMTGAPPADVRPLNLELFRNEGNGAALGVPTPQPGSTRSLPRRAVGSVQEAGPGVRRAGAPATSIRDDLGSGLVTKRRTLLK